MKRLKIVVLALLFVGFSVPTALADYIAEISYDYLDNGGGNYIFTFEVSNLSTGLSTGPLDYFEISFDADDISLYSNLTWVADNSWAVDAFEYDPAFGGIPAVSLADDSLLGSGGGGIAQGDSLGGFSVSFDYGGTLDPKDQGFSWYANFGTSDDLTRGTDLGGYSVLGEADGITSYKSSGQAPIPEPGTLLLVGTGLVGLAGIRRKRK